MTKSLRPLSANSTGPRGGPDRQPAPDGDHGNAAAQQAMDMSQGAGAARVVQGKGNYTYKQFSDGTVFIIDGPGISNPVRLTQGTAFDSITREIGSHPSPGESQVGEDENRESAQEAGGWLDWLAGQASEFGEGAAEVFESIGSSASELADSWWNPMAPSEEIPLTEQDDKLPQDVAGSDSEEGGFDGTGTPLEIALEKVGKVDYVSKNHGLNKRQKTSEERANLKEGKDEMTVASCSPFAYWALAASGVDINETIEGSDHNIRAVLKMEKSAMEGEDYYELVKNGDDRIHGAARAFELADIGSEIEKAEAAPGDFVQTFNRGGGGHCTIVHRAHLTGSAIFGLPNSPTLLEGEAPEKPTPLGFDGEPVAFVVSETTDPNLVGSFTSDKVELLSAHTKGTNSEGDQEEQGVYTKQAASLDDYNKAYVGRLSSSAWASRTLADPASYLEETTPVSETRSWWNPFT